MIDKLGKYIKGKLVLKIMSFYFDLDFFLEFRRQEAEEESETNQSQSQEEETTAVKITPRWREETTTRQSELQFISAATFKCNFVQA